MAGASTILGALAALGGGIAGAAQGRKDARIAQARFNQGTGEYDNALSAFRDRLSQSDPLIAAMLETAQSGLDEQRALVNDIGDYGYSQIADALSAGGGSLAQSFTSRGFAGSTMHATAGRGLAQDIARNYSNLSSQLAGVRSQTVRAALSDLMSAQQGAASYHAGAGSTMASLHAQKGQAILGVGHQPAQGIGAGWGQVGSFLGRALDEFIGGGGGGGGTGLAPGQAGPPLPDNYTI